MVIDFSRLNSAPPLPGSTRSNANQEAGSATQAAPAAKTAENTGTEAASGESVHLSPQAQQLQKVSDSLRDQPVVNKERVAALKQAIAEGSYAVDSNKVASKLLNIEAER